MEWVVITTPGPLYSGKKLRYQLYRRIHGLQDRSGRFWRREYLVPSTEFETRAVQAVASRYTNYAIPSNNCNKRSLHIYKYNYNYYYVHTHTTHTHTTHTYNTHTHINTHIYNTHTYNTHPHTCGRTIEGIPVNKLHSVRIITIITF